MTDVGRAVWLGSAGLLLVLGVALIAASLAGSGSPGPGPGETTVGPEPDLDRLHGAGITGENVTVGVVDVTGFDTSHSAYDERIVAARSFTPGESVGNGGSNGHGTAAAATVARTAPDADLYLASFDTVDGYARALEWLTDAGVDVVVAPVSFYGRPDDGSGTADAATTRAVRNGTVVVAPSGNLARGHWRGRYDETTDGAVRFGDDSRNYLASDAEELTLWLSWDRGHADEAYTAELHWTNGTATRLVARSQPYTADDAPNERIVADLDRGSYFVVVHGPENATGAHLELESPTHRLQHRSEGRSVAAPATAPGAVGVGAYDPASNAVEPFSSRGPTVDGRAGVDVVAANRFAGATEEAFVGSSASAAYVAGVSALLVQQRPDATPREIERVIERSAIDVGPRGVDPASGHGRVLPNRALALVNESTEAPPGSGS